MISEQEFTRISAFLKERYGIDMSRKKEIVNGRLENYVRRGNWGSYNDYMDAVEHDVTGELENKLVDLLSTNHTFFMREFDQFEYFRRVVLPWLREKETLRKDLCLWCGACSSGEEPYTLAMIIKDFFGLDHVNWDTKILATDVSTEALQAAMDGRYSADQVEALPQQWKRRFFKKSEDGKFYTATEELKGEVLFRKFNLMNPFPFKRKMHVVFLRNVMIYFDERTKNKLLGKIYEVMEPGGYLFIGQTETFDRSVIPFHVVQPSIFRKLG